MIQRYQLFAWTTTKLGRARVLKSPHMNRARPSHHSSPGTTTPCQLWHGTGVSSSEFLRMGCYNTGCTAAMFTTVPRSRPRRTLAYYDDSRHLGSAYANGLPIVQFDLVVDDMAFNVSVADKVQQYVIAGLEPGSPHNFSVRQSTRWSSPYSPISTILTLPAPPQFLWALNLLRHHHRHHRHHRRLHRRLHRRSTVASTITSTSASPLRPPSAAVATTVSTTLAASSPPPSPPPHRRRRLPPSPPPCPRRRHRPHHRRHRHRRRRHRSRRLRRRPHHHLHHHRHHRRHHLHHLPRPRIFGEMTDGELSAAAPTPASLEGDEALSLRRQDLINHEETYDLFDKLARLASVDT